jgi:hypothetical protein
MLSGMKNAMSKMRGSGISLTIAGLSAAGSCWFAQGEDVQLRSRAIALLNQAAMVSQIQRGPYYMKTEVSFNATAADWSLRGGTYTRIRSIDGSLRQDLQFGDYSASNIATSDHEGKTTSWEDPPFAVRMIRSLVPYRPGAFDSSDVIEQIKDGSYGGRQAECIVFETVEGETRLPGEACVDKANGTLLELRTGARLFEYSDYHSVKGGLFPNQIVFSDGSFSLTANIKMYSLDAKPEDAFTIPTEWKQGSYCTQFQTPVAKAAPQPPGEGAPDAPVTDVPVHLHLSATGAVSLAEVLRPVRPDLDAEAVKVVGKWVFEPGTCNGKAQEWVVDAVVHFQGWKVRDGQP